MTRERREALVYALLGLLMAASICYWGGREELELTCPSGYHLRYTPEAVTCVPDLEVDPYVDRP